VIGGLHPNLEQRVPKNHILKKIEEKVDMAREVEKQQVFLNQIRVLGYAWCTQCKFQLKNRLKKNYERKCGKIHQG